MTTTIAMAALAGIDVTLLSRCAKGCTEMRASAILGELRAALTTEDRDALDFRTTQLRAHNPKGCDADKRGVRCSCGAVVDQVRGLLSRGCSDFEDSAPTRSPLSDEARCAANNAADMTDEELECVLEHGHGRLSDVVVAAVAAEQSRRAMDRKARDGRSGVALDTEVLAAPAPATEVAPLVFERDPALTARDEYATQTITALAAGFDCECEDHAPAITATAAGAPSVASSTSTSAAPVTCECGGLSFGSAACDNCGCIPDRSPAPAILPATEHETRILDALYKAFGSCTVLYEATERSEALTMLRECGGNARTFARELLVLESVDCDRMGGNHDRHLGEMRARVQRALSMLGTSSNARRSDRAGARCPDCGRYLIAPQGKNWALTCCCDRNAEVR